MQLNYFKKKIININKRHLKLPDHPYSKKRIFEETFINKNLIKKFNFII